MFIKQKIQGCFMLVLKKRMGCCRRFSFLHTFEMRF